MSTARPTAAEMRATAYVRSAARRPITSATTFSERGRAARALLDAHARDRTGDHELLDLFRAFEDVVDLRVTVPALYRVLAHVAVAAEDLNGALGNPHG